MPHSAPVAIVIEDEPQIRRFLRAALKCDNALDETKKAASKAPQAQPPRPKISVPSSTAPATPERDSERRR